jgi:catechol 2,3-dioxygenase-like lactoylglutathione lyase family enzyme
MARTPQLSQIAMCSADLPRSVRIFTEVFGFADAGGRALWGEHLAQIQGLPGGDAVSCSVYWLVGRQDFVQIELFAHTTPPQRPLDADWRPNDLGWARWALVIPDFDAALDRLRRLGVQPLLQPADDGRARRACFREPGTQTIVELLEDGSGVPGGIRHRYLDLAPAVHSATLSVHDLDKARRFFVDTLGLADAPAVRLHEPRHEHLWGLSGARAESFVVRGGDVFVEVVRYDEPPGRPRRGDRLSSDQGFMNVAIGLRDRDRATALVQRCQTNGYAVRRGMAPPVGGTYVDDEEGNTVEILLVPRELDPEFGFMPRPELRRPLVWPQPSSTPAERE